jgi:hypothetical protein
MLDDRVVRRALRDLTEQIGQVEDPARLRELVVEINRLLDTIESQASKLGSGRPPFRH